MAVEVGPHYIKDVFTLLRLCHGVQASRRCVHASRA